MTVSLVLYAIAGVALLVGIARYVNRLEPEPEPIWWDGGDPVALDGEYVRDERLEGLR